MYKKLILKMKNTLFHNMLIRKKLGEARREKDMNTIKKWNTEAWKKLESELQEMQKNKFPIQDKKMPKNMGKRIMKRERKH